MMSFPLTHLISLSSDEHLKEKGENTIHNSIIEDIDVNNLTEPKILAIGSDKEELTTWLSKLDKHRGTNSRLVLPWVYE